MALIITQRPGLEKIIITTPTGARLELIPEIISYHGQRKDRLHINGPKSFSVSREPLSDADRRTMSTPQPKGTP